MTFLFITDSSRLQTIISSNIAPTLITLGTLLTTKAIILNMLHSQIVIHLEKIYLMVKLRI